MRAIYIIDIFAWVKLYTPCPQLTKERAVKLSCLLWVERAVAVLLYMLKTYPHAVPM